MSRWNALNGKDVVLKLDFIDKAIKATIVGEEDGVLLLTSPELEKSLTAPAQQIAAVMTQSHYYIPTARIQFVLAEYF